jgi:antitoxin component of MazEF toxin-antitoxin module
MESGMLVKVCKHGNSLSIRLGAYVTRTARIKCGDWVDVVLLSSGEIRITPKTGPEPLETDGETAPTDQAPAIEEERW